MLNLTPYRKHSNEAAMYNPFRELEDFERSIFAPDTLASFRTDIEDEGDKLVLSADLPGFDKKDIHLDVNGDTLTIHAERKAEQEEKDDKNNYVHIDVDDDQLVIHAERHSNYEKQEKKSGYLRCERSYGSYSRSFNLDGIDSEKISAAYDNGVLKLTLPKQAPAKATARRLEIE